MAATSPHPVARSVTPPPSPAWPLMRLLPVKLADIPADVRELVGRALDAGGARLVLDDDGGALVLRGVAR